MKRTLLLNSNGQPLQFMDGIRAIKLLLRGRAEVAYGLAGGPSMWEDTIDSTSRSFKLPAVLRLYRYVNKQRCLKTPPRFQKKVLFNRDNWSCQYCGVTLGYSSLSIDHILPVSRGGKTSWKNCVAACTICNSKKGNKTPEEAKMTLKNQPVEPDILHFWDTHKAVSWHPDWDIFMPAKIQYKI
jgi:5-methylcytosine-specific restriction endonuclease McrA